MKMNTGLLRKGRGPVFSVSVLVKRKLQMSNKYLSQKIPLIFVKCDKKARQKIRCC